MNKKYNKHGLQWKKEGNFLFIHTDRGKLAYIKWLDPDMFTREMVEDEFRYSFPFKSKTYRMDCEGTEIELPRNLMEFSRVNRHGVEFTLNGVRFVHQDMLYELGLPYQTDMSHIYTPELLIDIMNEFGTWSQYSLMWVRAGVKNKAKKTC